MSNQHKLLLQQVAAGSEPAMVTLYNAFESRIYNFVLSRLNNSFEASEVLNEVMLEIWKNAAKFKENSKVSTWIFGIAHHKTIDHLRKKYRHQREVEVEENFDIADESANAEQAILSSQVSSHVRDCIKQLKQPFKDIIHLTFFEELHYSDIAMILDCPEGTIKSRMFHAKSSLKNCLASIVNL